MPDNNVLWRESVSKRRLPINFDKEDLRLFEHELEKVIPATKLLELEDVKVNSDGIIFRGSQVLAESFASRDHLESWRRTKRRLKFFTTHYLFKSHKRLNEDLFWITDNWSVGYFHWMTDALPRLFTIRDIAASATLLLPDPYQKLDYVRSSLGPFAIQNIRYINSNEVLHCSKLVMPTHTAPKGNYNEGIIGSLRSLYTDFYESMQGTVDDKIYISRSKTKKRRIINEEEIRGVLEEYGFTIVHFEDYPFEQQIKIALNTRYLVSNHGAGLTNMLFMATGSNVLELRRKGDSHNNCYFSLASALNLNYFYQVCELANSGEDLHNADLIVDIPLLRTNIDLMLTTGQDIDGP